MDITCPQCKTEYEFEDSKVTEAGVTVKCTSCSFMFKVRRKAVVETEAVPPPLPPPSPSSEQVPTGNRAWMIRTASGQVYNFKELTTLQQWIVECKVSRDDHISRSGETWKRLGDIVELASFFQVVDAAMAGGAMGRASAPPLRAPSQSASPSASPQVERTLEPGSLGAPSMDEEPAFAASQTDPRFQVVGPSAAWEEGGSRLSGRHATVDLVDELPRRRSGRTLGIAIAAVAIVGLAVVGVLNRDRIAGLFSGGGEGSDEAYQNGRKLFLMDDAESLQQAEAELARAPQTHALAIASRAEVYTSWAQHIREKAEILDRRAKLVESGKGAGSDPQGMRLTATTLREEANQKLAQAERYAKKAIDLAPEKGEAKRAMADYLRLHGASNQEVLPYLTDARKKLPDDPEAIYVEGAFWLSQGNTARAEQMLRDALTKTKARYGQTLLRAALQLALIHLRAGKFTEARAQVDAILQANGKHGWARELLELCELEERAAVAGPTGKPDAGVKVALKPDSKVQRGSTPGPGPGPGTPSGEPPAGASYETLVKQGNALSEKGRTMQALKLFERALKQNPAGVEAMTGLGFCHLDQARFAAAIALFKKVLTVQATNGEALIGMAEAYRVQGNLSKALDYYRAYLQALPGGPKSNLAKRNIADLERKVGGTPTPTPTPDPTPTPTPDPTPAPPPPPEPKPDPAPAPAPKAEEKTTP